jgi:hypothetical protein
MDSRQVRAMFTDDTITVYQAYSPSIAVPAAAAGRFVPPFSRDRMTWIKPSFLWMMYRSAWATSLGQEHVLAVEISRAGFEEALGYACLSHYDRAMHVDRATWQRQLKASPVRVQWDPERSPRLQPLPYRSLQVGLSGPAVDRYVEEWIVSLTDITPTVHTLHDQVRAGDHSGLPDERPYPLPTELTRRIGA